MADFDLHEYNGSALIGTAAFFLGLSWLCVGLRTYTRARLTKTFQSDDWLMLIAQVYPETKNPGISSPWANGT